MKRTTTVGVAAELAAIPKLARPELLLRWKELFGSHPPTGLSTRLLRHAVAYQVQAQALGGLSRETERKLIGLAGTGQDRPIKIEAKGHSALIQPGVRLVREWHGRIYTVDVLEKGYLHDGRTYRSLSEIARAITGARWSGPRFFAP